MPATPQASIDLDQAIQASLQLTGSFINNLVIFRDAFHVLTYNQKLLDEESLSDKENRSSATIFEKIQANIMKDIYAFLTDDGPIDFSIRHQALLQALGNITHASNYVTTIKCQGRVQELDDIMNTDAVLISKPLLSMAKAYSQTAWDLLTKPTAALAPPPDHELPSQPDLSSSASIGPTKFKR